VTRKLSVSLCVFVPLQLLSFTATGFWTSRAKPAPRATANVRVLAFTRRYAGVDQA
jgi:hypothetical protein